MSISYKENHTVKNEPEPRPYLFEEKIFAEQVRLLYKNLLLSVPASLIGATIVLAAFYRVPHTSLLVYWFIAMVVISILRLGQTWLFFKNDKKLKAHFNLFLFLTIIAAALWGCTSILMPESLVEQMIAIIVIAGVTAGAIQSLQPSMIACLSYLVLVLAPLCLWIFSHNDSSYHLLGLATTCYLLFTLSISMRGYKFLKKTLKMKYENLELAEDVSRTNKQLKQTNQTLTEKETNLRLIHDNAPIGMAITSLEGKWLNVNNKLCEILGYSKEEFEHLTIRDVTYAEDLEIGMESHAKLLSGKISSYQLEKRYIHKNGQLIWILINVSLVRGKDAKPLYFISQIQDINERKQNEKIISGLGSMNEMLQLCESSSEAYSIISNAASDLVGISGGLSVLNKLTNELETVETWGDTHLIKPFFRSNDCWAFRAGKMYSVNDPKKELICHHFESQPLGGYVCIPLIVQSEILGSLSFMAPAEQTVTHYQHQIINNFSEIIKLSLSNINLNEALREQAIHDPLTGLFNRRYLNEWLPRLLKHCLHTNRSMCVCMLDLDHFKKVNDVYGHNAGDEVLKCIGKILRNNFREKDLACRFGGEEFVVVLIDTDIQQAIPRMETINHEVKHAQIYAQGQLLPPITISIGIAEAPLHGKNTTDLIREADSALYTAKEAGRDRIAIAETQVVQS